MTGATTGNSTASFVFSPAAPTTTTVVQFNASASTAPEGLTVASYAWNFGDTNTATGVTASNTFATAGTFNVVLTVTDSAGGTATTTNAVTVTAATAGNPTASFVFSPSAPTTETTVQFDATASTAPAGLTIDTYAWNFGDGGSTAALTVPTTTHPYTTAGTFTAVLTVTDSAGSTDTATQTVTVVGVSSTLPTAIFTASPSPTPIGADTIVDAAASTPSNGVTIASYTWNFGDTTDTIVCPVPAGGPADCGATPPLASHAYTSTGSFTITLTVTDSLDLTDTTTQTITVSAVADPTASFTVSPNPVTLTNDVTVNGSASTAASGRTIASYSWNWGDGTTDGTGVTDTHEYLSTGTFTITLTVTDSGTPAQTGVASVEVTVDP